MNPLKDPEDLNEATLIVNQYAQSDWLKLSFSDHALQRMRERNISHDMLLSALTNGQCVEARAEIRGKAMVYGYKMELRDQYGHVTAVTAIPGPHHLHIVTAFSDP